MTAIPYDVFGEGETIHFAHANGYPPQSYRLFLEQLAVQKRVLALHHRPLWSDADPWQTLTDWRPIADDLIRFLDQHNLSNIVGIGHSLGSVATFYASLQRPDLFSKLILIEPVFLPKQILAFSAAADTETIKQLPMVKAALKRRNQWASKDEAFERFRPKTPFKNFSDEALRDYTNAALKPNADSTFSLAYPRDWEARFYALAPQDVWELIPTLQHPTLGIRGADSDTLSAESWQNWQTLQPNATFVELPNSGHMLTMEQPNNVAATILNWLE